MKGLNILYVAAWRIFTNLGVALKVSWFWGTLIFALPIAATKSDTLAWLFWSLFLLVFLVGGSIVAVAWHRFCLLGEVPQSWFYLPPRDRTIAYIIGSLKLLFVIAILFVFLLIPIMIATFMGLPPEILNIFLSLFVGAFIAGLGLFLPAVALGQQFGLTEAWNASKTHYITLLIISVVITVTSYIYDNLISMVGLELITDATGVRLLLTSGVVVASGWFSFLFGIAYITEFYGSLLMDVESNPDDFAVPS